MGKPRALINFILSTYYYNIYNKEFHTDYVCECVISHKTVVLYRCLTADHIHFLIVYLCESFKLNGKIATRELFSLSPPIPML